MTSKHPNIQMLEMVAKGLGSLKEDVVFVGGTTTALYITDPAAPDIRPTNDVDCIIELAASGSSYYHLEQRLRSLGFQHDIKPSTVLCRWQYLGITVDIMPADGRIVGFTNRWYMEGIRKRIRTKLPFSDIEVYVLSFPCFLATKLEAFHGRGKNDLRMSHDIEDIVAVLDGNRDPLSALQRVGGELRDYLSKEFGDLLEDDGFPEALSAHLPFGADKSARADRIVRILRSFVG